MDHMLDSTGHRTHADHHSICTLGAIAHDAAVLAAENLTELLKTLVQNAGSGAHTQILRLLDFRKDGGRGQVVNGVRAVGI